MLPLRRILETHTLSILVLFGSTIILFTGIIVFLCFVRNRERKKTTLEKESADRFPWFKRGDLKQRSDFDRAATAISRDFSHGDEESAVSSIFRRQSAPNTGIANTREINARQRKLTISGEPSELEFIRRQGRKTSVAGGLRSVAWTASRNPDQMLDEVDREAGAPLGYPSAVSSDRPDAAISTWTWLTSPHQLAPSDLEAQHRPAAKKHI